MYNGLLEALVGLIMVERIVPDEAAVEPNLGLPTLRADYATEGT
jgi:hypothetical protein